MDGQVDWRMGGVVIYIKCCKEKNKRWEQIDDHLFRQNIVFGSFDKNYYIGVVSMKVQLEMVRRKPKDSKYSRGLVEEFFWG